MPDLAVIVPTRGRPDNIRKVIGAWDFTNAWDHADLVVVADADDPEIGGYRTLFVETSHPDTDEPLFQLVEVPSWVPMVHKLDKVAVGVAESRTHFAVGFAGDDHLPRTINWAARYLTVLRELGTGMVYGDDGYQGSKLSTEWAVTSDVVRALGRMVPAPVEHMYCDNSILELFTLAGAVRHLPEVRVEHMHPYAGKSESDPQYKRVNGRDQMHRDRVAYQRWRAKEAPAQVATVRALRRGKPQERPIRVARQQRGIPMTKPPRYFKRVQAATPEDIMVALADFAAQVPAGQEIVEIGVFMGRTALQLAWGARQGNRAHVTAIDAWDLPGNTYAPPFTYPATRRWAHHHVKTLGFSRDITLVQAFSTDAAMAYEGPPVGLLFVDGDHSEEGARRDIETWAPHLAPDARIAVDDYGHPDWPGVKTAVDKLVEEGFLDPIEIYHERLAVTRISVVGEVDRELNKLSATAITSEGVHPSPEPRSDICQKCGSGLLPDGEHVRTDLAPCHPPTSDEVLALFVQEGEADLATVHEESYRRQFVREGEAEGDTVGVSIDSLNIAQLKALAKRRGITLGARKDKRSEILQALRDGK